MKSRIAFVMLLLGALVVAVGCTSKASASPPDPPTNVAATPANGSASVSFTPPADDGGSPITGYTASCSTPASSGARGATGTASPIAVTGFAAGQTYTCIVTAKNDDGPSQPSQPSQSFVPVTVPGKPTPASAVPFNSGGAKVAWNAPTSTGGSPITAYVVTPYLGSVAQPVKTFQSTATTQNITGLTNGRSYQFAIAAKNAIGTSSLSTKTGVMIAGAPGQPGDAKAAKVASGQLKVTFIAPANNGASITSYTATCTSTSNGSKQAKTGASTAITLSNRALTVTGLTSGMSYTCTSRAQNSRGVGPNSAPSPAATA